jgi:hypothetical protein
MCSVIVSRWQKRYANPLGPNRPRCCLLVEMLLPRFQPTNFRGRITVSHPCNRRVSPKEWMEARACLWDFVGDERRLCSIRTPEQANSCSFMRVLGCEFLMTCWHMVCSPPQQRCQKDWLPGVAGSQPRLGFRFWGVSSKEKGGLHQPPFSLSGCDCSVVSSRLPWVVPVVTG